MTFRAIYSAEDGEWVGLCAQYPSLSWLAPTQADALDGIRRLVAAIEQRLGLDQTSMPPPEAEEQTVSDPHVKLSHGWTRPQD